MTQADTRSLEELELAFSQEAVVLIRKYQQLLPPIVLLNLTAQFCGQAVTMQDTELSITELRDIICKGLQMGNAQMHASLEAASQEPMGHA